MTRTQIVRRAALLATPLFVVVLLGTAGCGRPEDAGELQPFPSISLAPEAEEPDCVPVSAERVTYRWGVSRTMQGDEPSRVKSVDVTVGIDGADVLHVDSVTPEGRGAATSVSTHGEFRGTTATLQIISNGRGQVRDRFTLTSCRDVLHQFSVLAPEPGSPAFARPTK